MTYKTDWLQTILLLTGKKTLLKIHYVSRFARRVWNRYNYWTVGDRTKCLWFDKNPSKTNFIQCYCCNNITAVNDITPRIVRADDGVELRAPFHTVHCGHMNNHMLIHISTVLAKWRERCVCAHRAALPVREHRSHSVISAWIEPSKYSKHFKPNSK